MKIFSCQPIYWGIWFRPACKLCQKISYRNTLWQPTLLNTSPLPTPTCTSTYLYDSTYKKSLRQSITCTRKYHSRKTCHNLQKYTQSRLKHHFTLLHMTTFPHQTYSIRKFIPSSHIIFLLVKSEKSRFKHISHVPMSSYRLNVLSCHQRNTLFLIFARDLKNSLENCLLRSHIQPLTHISYLLNHAT